MNFDIRPKNMSIVVKDRKKLCLVLKDILGFTISRHIEHEDSDKADGPQKQAKWCKTDFTHSWDKSKFTVQVVHFYNSPLEDAKYNGVTISYMSERSLAKAKSYDVGTTTADRKAYILNNNVGPNIHLLYPGAVLFANCEVTIRTTRMVETAYFWNTLLGVPTISKTDNDFTLFFDNYCCRIKYLLTTKSAKLKQPFHLTFTAPKDKLVAIQHSVEESSVVQPLCQVTHVGRDGDHLVVLKDPNDYLLYFYDRTSYKAQVNKSKLHAEAKYNLSLFRENNHS